MNDDELREHHQAHMRERPSGEGCPDGDSLLALVERTGDEADRLATLDHVMACADCRRELDLLRAMHEARDTIEAESDRPRPLRLTFEERLAISKPLAIAASVSLLVGAAALYAVLRSDGGGTVMRGAGDAIELIAPATNATVALPATLTWRSVEDAVEYRIEVSDSAGPAVLTTAATDTTVTLGAGTLTAAATYSWFVRAIRLDGSEVRSDARRFRLAR